MTLQEKTQKLISLRKEIDDLDLEYEARVAPMKAEKEELQKEILKAMGNEGQYSARFEFATVTRAVRKSLSVVDEKELVKHLKETGLSDYVSERPNELFEGVKKEAVKNGVALPGTELRETEYISLKEPEKEADRRKVSVE